MRYIDADALIERLKFKRDKCDIDNKKHAGLDCAISQINNAPTEDVVPRAELELNEKAYESLNKLYDNDTNELSENIQRLRTEVEEWKAIAETYQKMFEDSYEGKQEVAREIFEKLRQEIKSALDSNYKAKNEHFARHHYKNPNDEFMNMVSGKIIALRGIDDFIDEIEMKYIGD